MAEISLAVVSLTFQVFSGCVQGYEFIIDAKHMPADCQYLRVRLQTEKYRLLDWAEVVRLDETDERLLISNFNKGLLYDVLDQQRRLLTQFGRLDDEYKHLSKPLLIDYEEPNGVLPGSSVRPAIEEGSTIQRADTNFKDRFPQQKALLKKSLAWAKKTAGQTRRLKWVGFDKTKMETLLGKLTGLNDFMRGMLNTAQLESLSINQLRTNFQIMQLNSSVQYLVQIIESTSVLQKQGRRKSRNVTDPLGSYMQAQGLIDNDDDAEVGRPDVQGLAALAQIKALNSALSEPDALTDEVTSAIALQHSASETLNVELNRADIKIIDPDTDETSESQRVEAIYHPPKGRKTSVWIEWKTYEPPPFQPTGPDQKIHERVKALAALLKENNSTNQHNQFRAPHCLGYFQDTDPETHEDHCRFGLVFEKPDTAHSSTRPISLHTLLTKPELDMPSLTDRITLMRLLSETIERLHAVNWLHKGLRSANILFFSDSGPAEISYNDPYISGFDYSRPAMNDDMTEKPPENAASDIYRHPRVQGSGGREGPGGGFKKSYDLYSLGVILLEIAYWKPIDQIMGIPNLERAKPSVTFNVRRRLMNEKDEGFLKHVKSHLGNTVYAVVKACLEGPQAFGLPEGADEKKGEIGAELQTSFYEKVVKEFVNMRV